MDGREEGGADWDEEWEGVGRGEFGGARGDED